MSWSKTLSDLFLNERRKLEALARKRCTDPEQVGDVVQDAFLRLVRLSAPEAVEKPAHLLFKAAANITIDYNRRTFREWGRDGGELDPDHPSSTPNAETKQAETDRQTILNEAVAALPLVTREIFVRFHLDGRSYRQIADERGMDLKAVEYHLRDGMKACRRYARERE